MSRAPILLDHRVDLYLPSQCICGQVIPEALRNEVILHVKSKFEDWFGAQSEATIKGDWPLPDGTRAKEEFADIYSFCTTEAIEHHASNVDQLAVEVANRLTQDRVLRVFDNLKVALWPNTITGLKKGRNCSCKCVAVSGPVTGVKPIGIRDANWLEKLLYIQGILGAKDFSVEHAKELFRAALNYRQTAGDLPTLNWPPALRALVVGMPSVIADQNGFKIVNLQMAADSLKRSAERLVIQRIYKDDPTFRGLFVFSDRPGNSWELVNVQAHGEDAKRLNLRRMRVGVPAIRTATERLATLEIAEGEEASISADAIQARHDKAFDVEAVTKAFFTEIANWYFWALKNVCFPEHAPREQDGHDHVSVIRMITRLIFCWFVKEKGLLPEELFDRKRLSELLVGFEPEKVSQKESVYYKAVLQNLFFATLNTEMDKRGWAKEEQNFMAHSLYRYKEFFAKPAEALKFFKDIPFLNGGLFECLDKDLGEGRRPRYIRIDGFSRRPDSQPVVPDFLFFGPEKELDLSEDYGDKAFRKVKVQGLINILQRYHFTVEESTPLEQEVALDPELAGKIFENLLAAYNPETGTTARKQSGSFYTPREIVNYMVDEALIAYVKGRLEKACPEAADVEPRLRHLFSYEEEGNNFTPAETELLISAIDQLKALDPAVGSGAFPMGILHKLVFILGRLDPRNERWKERQKKRLRDAMAAAERIEDATIRERTLKELEQQVAGVEEAFEKNALDYGRKLYLIENCLYGVDIQPIAVQIAKMRFFISLIADQKVDPAAENLGVRPLPNLETKLVAANTLIAIERPAQQLLRNPRIDALEAELRRVREKHFMARTLASKSKCRQQDGKLREEIADLLKKDGWLNATAKQLAAWDPYDQNASAGFFDSEWMFGLVAGFDVVIGNPPYVRIQVLNQADPEQVQYLKGHYISASKGNYDIYVVFVERGLQLAASSGQLAYILPHKYFNAQYGEPLRDLISKGRQLRHVVHFGDQQIFPGATNYVCLLFLAKAGVDECDWARVENLPAWLVTQEAAADTVACTNFTSAEWNVAVGPAAGLFAKLGRIQERLGLLAAHISQGIRTSANEVFVLDKVSEEGGLITAYSKILDQEVIVERGAVINFLRGREIKAYSISSSGKVVIVPYQLANNRMALRSAREMRTSFPQAWKYLTRNQDYLKARENGRMAHEGWYGYVYPKNLDVMLSGKLLVPDIADRAAFAYDEQGDYSLASGYAVIIKPDVPLSVKYILGLLNSRLLDWYWKQISTPLHGGFYRYFTQFMAQLPIPPLDLRTPSERAEHKAIVNLVDSTLAAKRSTPEADTSTLEHEIDERVYKLYGLTKDEIKIVEKGR